MVASDDPTTQATKQKIEVITGELVEIALCNKLIGAGMFQGQYCEAVTQGLKYLFQKHQQLSADKEELEKTLPKPPPAEGPVSPAKLFVIEGGKSDANGSPAN